MIAVGHPLLAWWVARRPYWSRLRRAAVEWARELLAQERVRTPRDPRTRAVVVVLVVVWGATALGLLVARLTSGEGIDVPWGVVAVWVVVGIWGVRRRHGLRRTAELKDEPAADGG